MARVQRLPNTLAGKVEGERADGDADLQVLGIGNAIVDVIAHASDEFLDEQALVKGSMRLVDTEGAESLYLRMGPGMESSGGSAANTMAGIASLGGRAGFIGKVHDDELGRVFTHDIQAAGVTFASAPATTGAPTARCLILVTPDAQRTMSTYLGASTGLTADDVDDAVVASSLVTYLEGYLWDPPEAKDAFRKAMDAAHAAGRRVAFTLSDAFCVDRFRSEFLELVADHVDVLFANEAELLSLYEMDDVDAALDKLRGACEFAAITRSEKGSVVLAGGERLDVPAHPVDRVIDTTGAGDLYAAGFLHGLTTGADPETCARLGSLCAAEIISHVGARPLADLAEMAAGAGLR